MAFAHDEGPFALQCLRPGFGRGEGGQSAVAMGASPDWVKLAEAFGATGMRCDRSDDLEEAMVQALATEGPVVVGEDEEVPPAAAEEEVER